MANDPERIERLDVIKDDNTGKLIKNSIFYNGPAEFLVVTIVDLLEAEPGFKELFSDDIDAYKRMDYSIRQLPAIRVYNDVFRKLHESWFLEGDIKADIIFPASLRRDELQQIQDTVSAAVLQQFRRPSFFLAAEKRVPGLNELGKTMDFDKSLGFQFEEAEVPLTQITLNFKLDLRIWDDYLTQTYRTKDSPFAEILGDLDRINAKIQGLKDDLKTTEVELGVNTRIK